MKGQLQIQFNWIFVLVVGGIILLFFTNIVLQQREESLRKMAVTVINDLETVATGAGVSKGTAQVLKKPDIDLEFNCEFCDCKFSMKESTKPFGDMRIFAPRKIVGRQMIAWTQDWNAPFRITNFLFITGPQVLYYVVDPGGPTDIGDFINESLPSTIVTGYMDTMLSGATMVDNNYPQVKIIYLSIDGSSCPPIGDTELVDIKTWDIDREDVTAVCIHSYAIDRSRGKIQFYEVDKDWEFVLDGPEMDFIGEESIFAAFFAYDFDTYVCNIQDALDRMVLISRIYKTRINNLTSGGVPSDCAPLYTLAESYLDALVKNATELSEDGTKSFGDYFFIQQNLSDYNSQLHLLSCPSIY